jgi:molecular chaperone GrpE
MQNDGNGKKIEGEAPAHEEKVSEAHEEHKKKKKKEEILEELKQKLEEKEKEAGELKERLLYQQADFENETLVKDLLPVIDNLERAIQHGCKSEDSKAIVEGVELTLNSFLKVLEKFGVTRVDALERGFDPNVHEAIAQEAREDKAPGTVVTELQKGYIMDGRLLRPSMVTVAKSSEKE